MIRRTLLSCCACAWLLAAGSGLPEALAAGAPSPPAPTGTTRATARDHLAGAGSPGPAACQRRGNKPGRPQDRPKQHAPRQSGPPPISAEPYIGAIVIEAVTGQVLFEENADAIGYPASVIKLLDLLIVLEEVRRGTLALTDPITITAEAARMGGSQVYLKEGERFSVEELLYALIVQSANDAAMALALHVGGSRAAFLERMNRRAQELGLTASRFYSVHGLPPGRGQEFDVTTARDMALLARAVTQHQETFRYTSTREHPFRDGSFIVRTHNHLLGSVPGCDGLKTGYIRAGGYSIAATAERNGLRIITVVLGSKQRKVRDLKARTLLDLGYQRAKALGLPPSMPLAAGKAAPSSTAGAGAGAAAVGTAAAPADGRQPAGGGAETGTGSTSPAPPIAVPQVPRLPSLGSPALWGAGGLLTGLLLGYLIFGRLARRRTLL